jgi:hypothetical protein
MEEKVNKLKFFVNKMNLTFEDNIFAVYRASQYLNRLLQVHWCVLEKIETFLLCTAHEFI